MVRQDNSEDDKRRESFEMDREIDNTWEYPISLRCSDGAEINESAKNWGEYLKNQEGFQSDYIERVKRWINRHDK